MFACEVAPNTYPAGTYWLPSIGWQSCVAPVTAEWVLKALRGGAAAVLSKVLRGRFNSCSCCTVSAFLPRTLLHCFPQHVRLAPVLPLRD